MVICSDKHSTARKTYDHNVIIQDPNAFFTHNEFNLGIWRIVFVPFGNEYMEEHRKRIPRSELVEEWDGLHELSN